MAIKRFYRELRIKQKLKEFWHKDPSTYIGYEDADIYFRTLGDLLSAGLDISESLTIAAQSVPRHQNKLLHIKDLINSGQSLYAATINARIVLSPSITTLLAQSEYDDSLSDISLRCADFAAIYAQLHTKIVQALLYPVLCSIVVICMTLGILLGVVPHIQEVLLAFPLNIPWYTQITLYASKFLRMYPFETGGCVVLLGTITFLSRRILKDKILYILQMIPHIKEIHWLNVSIEYLPLLMLTIKNPRLYAQSDKFNTMRKEIIPIHQSIVAGINSGRLISESLLLIKLPLSNPRYVSKIRVGERNGTLLIALSNIRNELLSLILKKLDTLIRIIEPCALLIIALIVGGLAMSILTPLYSLTQVLRH
jgi:type II secretory pathway component PulF